MEMKCVIYVNSYKEWSLDWTEEIYTEHEDKKAYLEIIIAEMTGVQPE